MLAVWQISPPGGAAAGGGAAGGVTKEKAESESARENENARSLQPDAPLIGSLGRSGKLAQARLLPDAHTAPLHPHPGLSLVNGLSAFWFRKAE